MDDLVPAFFQIHRAVAHLEQLARLHRRVDRRDLALVQRDHEVFLEVGILLTPFLYR